MASRHDLEQQNDDSIQGEMASSSGKYQQYPPPQALPDYVNRALPPRPSSNSSASSIYESVGNNTQEPVKSAAQPLVTENSDENISLTRTDAPNETGLIMIQPPQPVITATAPQTQEHEIASPQPRYPASKVLEVKKFAISPVSATLPGNDANNNNEVSPVSPSGSERSLHSRISESSRHSNSAAAPPDNSCSIERTPTNKSDRRRVAVFKGYRTTHTPGDPRSPQSHQVHQINDRYSDPGSPITGAVIHPPTSFPSDPSLRASRRLKEGPSSPSSSYSPQSQKQQEPTPIANPNSSPVESPTATKLEPVSSAGSSTQKVMFAGPGINRTRTDSTSSGFAARPRGGNSKKAGRPPPPLKLSERALVDSYVKTPFPNLDIGGDEGGDKKKEEKQKEGEREKEKEGPSRSRFSHGGGEGSLDGGGAAVKTRGTGWFGIGMGREKDKSKEKEKNKENESEGGQNSPGAKKRNRVSSLPGFGLGFARALRSPSGGNGSKDGGEESQTQIQTQTQTATATAAPSEVRAGYVETRPSRTPSVTKVKNMLSKAKQIGLSPGRLMMGGSEEAKKERRRAEMKRQIRVGEPRPA